MSKKLAVFLRRLFDIRCGLRQILGTHKRMKLHAGVECQKKWFRHARDLGSIGEIDNEVSGAVAALRREINRFRFQIGKNGLNGFPELALLDQRVAGLDGRGRFDQKTSDDLLEVLFKWFDNAPLFIIQSYLFV